MSDIDQLFSDGHKDIWHKKFEGLLKRYIEVYDFPHDGATLIHILQHPTSPSGTCAAFYAEAGLIQRRLKLFDIESHIIPGTQPAELVVYSNQGNYFTKISAWEKHIEHAEEAQAYPSPLVSADELILAGPLFDKEFKELITQEEAAIKAR